MQITDDELKLGHIFHPFHWGKHAAAINENMRFVHYTTADAAVKILKSKQVWMRNSSSMNDWTEGHHGLWCLREAWHSSSAGKDFRDALNFIENGIDAEIAPLFDGWAYHFTNGTYLSCFSEHDASENTHGRLSMWRSYGASGVAFVMNNGPFLAPSDALKAYSSPVAYLSKPDFQIELEKVTANIRANADYLRSKGRETLKARVFHMLRMATLCTKHPGFAEEREWRVFHTPQLQPSSRLVKEIEVIKGVPQLVYKIPLKDIPEEGFVGAEIPQLIERVIIGPSQFPLVIRDAIVELLIQRGMKDAHLKVFISEIPLRG